VVVFIKNNSGGKVTLAIGDGGNDVNMIQQAHIGFGIMGKEGDQAAVFADYAIPSFKDLRRALFWHGRPYGSRMVTFLGWNLYRSMISSTTKYCMQWQNGFSGFQPVDGLLLSLYDIVMVTIYLTYTSVFDNDVEYSLD
jgi:phospholipid-translocating ATPase